MSKNIYFMEFIMNNIPKIEEFVKILENRTGNKIDHLEDFFSKVSSDMIVSFFITYLSWTSDFSKLGFSSREELKSVHLEWHKIVRECKHNKGKILFRRPIKRLEIKFK